MTAQLSRSTLTSKQPLTLSWRNVAFFSTFHALALLAPWFFSWSALGVTIALHWLFGSIGICLGYHRLLTHRSFQVSKGLEYTFGFLGALAMQGGPIFWVAGHRMHHAFTEDVDKDPYSARRGFGGAISSGFCILVMNSLRPTPTVNTRLTCHAIGFTPGSIATFCCCNCH